MRATGILDEMAEGKKKLRRKFVHGRPSEIHPSSLAQQQLMPPGYLP
jgi:hypothetical protein